MNLVVFIIPVSEILIAADLSPKFKTMNSMRFPIMDFLIGSVVLIKGKGHCYKASSLRLICHSVQVTRIEAEMLHQDCLGAQRLQS